MSQINKPSDYFNTVLYTGNGSTQSISGVNFTPDLVWIKERQSTSAHHLFDVIRGTLQRLRTNETAEESTLAGSLTSFDSDGFSLGNSTNVNENTQPCASWNWLGGGTASSNTDGSITSQVSANTTSGFSVVSFTSNSTSGATIGHGLGVAPSMVIIKRRSSAEDWGVGHQSLGWTNFLRLNTTGASSAATGLWNDTAPSSTVVTLGNSGISNPTSGTTMIAYCFAEKKGFSKFGSWIGNGNADGTFVYLGFKPEFVMLKNTDGTNQWLMFDNTREPANIMGTYLEANSSNAEANFDGFDFLSNGMKMRTSNNAWNASGNKYIYMAFASEPLVGTNNIPATAR